MELAYIVGLLLVLLALGTVVVMFWAILREPHEHLEHYIPPTEDNPEAPVQPAAASASAES
jgi:hypothetical protein